MKKVTIKEMHLVNWRGAKDVRMSFSGEMTQILGANGTGKSTLFEAFLWCLFGKDSQGRTDFEIKRAEGGEPLQKVDAEVEITLNVSGYDVTLKRVLHEKWGKPRGQMDEVFRGNETLCFVDDVPLKVSEYKAKVDEIIDESKFKLLTNPDYFLNLDWQTQREVLFSIAGARSDEEIASGDKEFEELLDLLSNKSVVEYKKEIASKKRKAKDELATIQPRIDEAERLKPEELNWGELEGEVDALNIEKHKLQESLNDESLKLQSHLEEKRVCEQEIDAIQREIYRVKQEVKASDDKRFEEENKRRGEINSKIRQKAGSVDSLKNRKASLLSFIDTNGQQIASYKARVEAYRSDWTMENAREYSGDDVCPTCHQKLPMEMIESARKLFNEQKAKKLKDIIELGNNANAVISSLEKENATSLTEVESIDKSIERLRGDIEALEAELKSIEKTGSRGDTVLTDVREYNDLCDKLTKKQADLKVLREKDSVLSSNEEVKKQIAEIEVAIAEASRKLSTRNVIEKHDERVRELNQQSKELSQLIADYEKSEMVIQRFTRAKIEDIEYRINSMFKMVTFQLFAYTQEGNEVETCIPKVDGVVYGVANTAGKVNAGVDVINTLSRHFGTQAPIWIDNAERISEIVDTDSQTIKLGVHKDYKELTRVDNY